MLQPIAIAKLRKIRCARMSTFLWISGVPHGKCFVMLVKVRVAQQRKGCRSVPTSVGARYVDVRDYMRKPGMRYSPKRGLAVNSWVGGKRRPPCDLGSRTDIVCSTRQVRKVPILLQKSVEA